MALNETKTLVLCITAGRSGTRWLSDIFSAHKNAHGGCERNGLVEAFYRYIKWNNLPIDDSGILEITKRTILNDWDIADISIIASPYFSHDLLNLIQKLKVDKIIWGINDPVFTITSFYNKGVFLHPIKRNDQNLAIGYQPALKNDWKKIFGRIVPRGTFFNEWESLTRIGKISWLLNALNLEIHSYIKELPKEMVWIFRLEEADQNYEYYIKLAKDFGLKPLLKKGVFLSLKEKTVRKSHNIRKVWSENEMEEYEKYAADYISLYNKLKNSDI